MASPLSVGVEEEFLLVDSEHLDVRGRSAMVLRSAYDQVGGDVQPELYSGEVESATPVCWTLDELGGALRRRRELLGRGAAEAGCRLFASGTHPFARWQDQRITPKARYLGLAEEYQQVAHETMICGQHIHVGIPEEEQRIDVLNRVRPWLGVFTALGSNSPFWEGLDTGYASYRTLVFRRWPTNRVPRRFEDWADYRRVVGTLVASGAVDDPTKLYWDVRPSERFPTLEFRVGDVCLRVADAVCIAGLVRALVARCLADAAAGLPAPEPLAEVLESAVWKAARFGLGAELIDPLTSRSTPAREVVGRLLNLVEAPLRAAGDAETVDDGIERILEGGTGAARQRSVVERGGDLKAVARFVAAETSGGL
ncbi:MAG TPA: glutamate--cysteine ligase [Acidimicrobiales bacterium]|jgi:carboxylate-amine ligase